MNKRERPVGFISLGTIMQRRKVNVVCFLHVNIWCPLMSGYYVDNVIKVVYHDIML